MPSVDGRLPSKNTDLEKDEKEQDKFGGFLWTGVLVLFVVVVVVVHNAVLMTHSHETE